MSADQSCPDPALLRGLLQGSLSAADPAGIANHVEACSRCQQLLDQWTNDPDMPSGHAPDAGPNDVGESLRRVLDRLKASPPTARESQTTVDQALADTVPDPLGKPEEPIDFLQPPTTPGTIGRFGPYSISEVIGRGGFGIVLKGFDAKLHRLVAIKVLAPALATSAVARTRFIREAQAAAAVVDEHVVTIHAVDEAGDLPYIVMQYVAGMSLQQKIDRTGSLEVKETLRIGMQVAQGLAAAHAQGLVHRDIKPANILLENGVQRVKITDFGLARAADDASLTTSGVVAGTPMYMAPEQARDDPIDQRTDLFSLGSVLYAMCAGRAPFRARSTMAILKRVCEDAPTPIRELNPEVPGRLAEIIKKLHAKDAAGRYQTATEVAEVLGQHLAEIQLPARPVRPVRWRKAAVVVAMVMIVGLAATAMLGGPRLRGWFTSSTSETPAPSFLRQAAPGEMRVDRTSPSISPSTPRLVDWETGPFDETFPGLAPAPAKLSGALCWQIETRAPRGLIRSVVWNPKNDWIAVVANDPAIRIYDASDKTLLRVLVGHFGGINGIAWSPDGRRLASVGLDRTLRLWNAALGTLEQTVPASSALSFESVAWSKDGRWLAAGGWRRIHIWDVNRRDPERTILTGQESGALNSVVFSPDGRWIASSCYGDKIARLWKASDGTPGPVLKGHEGDILSIAFDPDGQRLATASADSTVRLWNTADGKPGPVLTGHTYRVNTLAFSADGKFLASGSEDDTVRLWDTLTWQTSRITTTKSDVLAISISPDSRRIVSGNSEELRITNRGDDTPGTVLIKPTPGANSIAIHPEGHLLASAHWDATVRLWNTANGAPSLIFKGHPTPVYSVVFSPDGKHLGSADNHTIRFWETDNGSSEKVIATEPVVRSLAWSPDGRSLAALNRKGNVRVFDTESDAPGLILKGVENYRPMVAFTPNGRRLGVAYGPRACIWNVDDGTAGPIIQDGWFNSLSFHPDGKRFVTAGNELVIRETETGKRLKDLSLSRPGSAYVSLAFSHKGRLAAGCSDGTIFVCNLETGEVDQVLPSRSGYVSSIAFAGEDRLAAASDDGTVRLWDLATKRPLWVALPVNADRSARITSGGRLLASELGDTHGFVYLVQKSSGSTVEMLAPAEFESQFGAALDRQESSVTLRIDSDREIAKLTARLRANPNESDAFVRRGHLYMENRQFDRSLTDLEAAIRINPKNPEAHLFTAQNLLRTSVDFDRALAECKEAITLAPKDLTGLKVLAEIHVARNELDAAITVFDGLLKTEPKNARAFAGRGSARLRKNDYEACIVDCTEAIKLDRNQLWAYETRARALCRLKQYEQSIADCTEAIRLDSSNPYQWDNYRLRGFAYEKLKQHALAVADCDEALRLNPRNPEAYYVRGLCHTAQDKLEQAIDDYSKAIQFKPKYAEALRERAAAYEKRGESDKAKADREAADRIRP